MRYSPSSSGFSHTEGRTDNRRGLISHLDFSSGSIFGDQQRADQSQRLVYDAQPLFHDRLRRAGSQLNIVARSYVHGKVHDVSRGIAAVY